MDEYLVNRVLTASPQQLHLMVVDGCIRHTRQAELAIAEQRWDDSHTALTEARAHLTHLLSGINPQADDEFLVNLRGLFKLAYKLMTLADLQRDAASLPTALAILTEHRETWKLVIEATTDSAAPASDSLKLSA